MLMKLVLLCVPVQAMLKPYVTPSTYNITGDTKPQNTSLAARSSAQRRESTEKKKQKEEQERKKLKRERRKENGRSKKLPVLEEGAEGGKRQRKEWERTMSY